MDSANPNERQEKPLEIVSLPSLSSIDLNCDVGEISPELDAQILPLVSSCNVSCGAHAGDPQSISQTIAAAQRLGVAIGAHPSYPDRAGFGRRSLAMPTEELQVSLIEQITHLKTIAAAEQGIVRHIKPHGALYHDLTLQKALAQSIAQTLHQHFPECSIYGMAGGELERACKLYGSVFIPEGFADRVYADRHQLLPRTAPGSMIETFEQFTEHFTLLIKGRMRDASGCEHVLAVQTLCLHSDGPHALPFAQLANEILREQHVAMAAPAP